MSNYDSSVETGRRQYYSSSQGPFHNANNIFMFYGGGDRGQIVESIIRSLRADEQLIEVRGEHGSGKTMLSLVLSDRMKNRYNTIRYDVPDISESLLLRHLLIELCPQKADLISAEQAQSARKPYILFIDSKATLDAPTFRILEQLTAISVAGDSIFHCVVFSVADNEEVRCAKFQPDSEGQSNQYWLRRLTLVEINDYLRHHMMLFDFNRRDLFTREMAYFIADRSEGVFRSINKLSRNAFTIASLESADQLSIVRCSLCRSCGVFDALEGLITFFVHIKLNM